MFSPWPSFLSCDSGVPGTPGRSVRQFSVFSFQYSLLITRYWALRTQLSTRGAFPVPPHLPTYAPPRRFCARGADRVAFLKLLTALNLRNVAAPFIPVKLGKIGA